MVTLLKWLLVISIALASVVFLRESKGADFKLISQILMCESSGRMDILGDDGVSYGVAQFRKETFFEFAEMSGLKGPRYEDPIHQIKLLDWGLKNGYGNRWSCYTKIKKGDWPKNEDDMAAALHIESNLKRNKFNDLTIKLR